MELKKEKLKKKTLCLFYLPLQENFESHCCLLTEIDKYVQKPAF